MRRQRTEVSLRPENKEEKAEMEKVKKEMEKILESEYLREYHFERNKPLGPVTIDFYCELYRFAIVIDRDEDFFSEASSVDPASQSEMERMGVVVLRFRVSEIRKNPYIVERTIAFWLKDRELNYL